MVCKLLTNSVFFGKKFFCRAFFLSVLVTVSVFYGTIMDFRWKNSYPLGSVYLEDLLDLKDKVALASLIDTVTVTDDVIYNSQKEWRKKGNPIVNGYCDQRVWDIYIDYLREFAGLDSPVN